MTSKSHFGITEVWFQRSVMMLLCMMLFLLSGVVFGAADSDRKVVRIPSVEFNRFMVLDENRNPVSGYAYEYIDTIGIYAGWDIQFIPCDSFSDGLKMLISGEADLFYDVSYTEDRANEMLFPDEPMGFEYYYLYALRMPEMNGTQLSAEVKSNPKFAHIPIVAQTADVETSGNFDMSHFDAIILKPITKEKLSNMVKRIFEDGDLRKGNGGGAPVNLG